MKVVVKAKAKAKESAGSSARLASVASPLHEATMGRRGRCTTPNRVAFGRPLRPSPSPSSAPGARSASAGRSRTAAASAARSAGQSQDGVVHNFIYSSSGGSSKLKLAPTTAAARNTAKDAANANELEVKRRVAARQAALQNNASPPKSAPEK